MYAEGTWLTVLASSGTTGADLVLLFAPLNTESSRHTTLHMKLGPSHLQSSVVITQEGGGLSPLSITTSGFPGGAIGIPYAPFQLAGTGGSGAYTWSLDPGGALPSGMSLSQAGFISGTPAVGGTATFTVRLGDDQGTTQATKSLSLEVAHAAISLVVTGKSGPHYLDTDSFMLTAVGPPNSQVTVFQNGAPYSPANWKTDANGIWVLQPNPYPWSQDDIGMHSQVWSVGPYTAGGSPLVFYVDSSNPLTISTASLPPAVVSQLYSPPLGYGLAASGGTGTVTWSLASGSLPLPGGMTLSTSGQLSGTPGAAGNYPITVRVADTAAHAAEKAFTLVVTAVAPPADPVFNPVSQTFSGPLTVTLTSPGAVIYYTTDGSTPSATHGTQYSGSFTVSATETVKAIATQSAHPDSNVTSAIYTLCQQSIKEFVRLNGRALAVETSCAVP
jgi:hypothetical protein